MRRTLFFSHALPLPRGRSSPPPPSRPPLAPASSIRSAALPSSVPSSLALSPPPSSLPLLLSAPFGIQWSHGGAAAQPEQAPRSSCRLPSPARLMPGHRRPPRRRRCPSPSPVKEEDVVVLDEEQQGDTSPVL